MFPGCLGPETYLISSRPSHVTIVIGLRDWSRMGPNPIHCRLFQQYPPSYAYSQLNSSVSSMGRGTFILITRPSIVRFPAPISHPSRLAKPAYIPPYFGNAIHSFSTTIVLPSKRDPTMGADLNKFDQLETLLERG